MFAADIAWRRQGPRVQVLEANLRRVTGPQATGKQLRALSREGMRSYARYWLEVFRLPVISRERILGDMRCTGEAPRRCSSGAALFFVPLHLCAPAAAAARRSARG